MSGKSTIEMNKHLSDKIELPKVKKQSSVVVGISKYIEESKFSLPQNRKIVEDSEYDSEDANAQEEVKQLNDPHDNSSDSSSHSFSDSGSESMHSQLSSLMAV